MKGVYLIRQGFDTFVLIPFNRSSCVSSTIVSLPLVTSSSSHSSSDSSLSQPSALSIVSQPLGSTGGSEEVVSSPSVKLLSSRMKSLMILSFTGMEVYWTDMSIRIEK